MNGLKSTIAYLDENDFERIHEASCKILKETGVVFKDDEAVELFKKHGAYYVPTLSTMRKSTRSRPVR